MTCATWGRAINARQQHFWVQFSAHAGKDHKHCVQSSPHIAYEENSSLSLSLDDEEEGEELGWQGSAGCAAALDATPAELPALPVELAASCLRPPPRRSSGSCTPCCSPRHDLAPQILGQPMWHAPIGGPKHRGSIPQCLVYGPSTCACGHRARMPNTTP